MNTLYKYLRQTEQRLQDSIIQEYRNVYSLHGPPYLPSPPSPSLNSPLPSLSFPFPSPSFSRYSEIKLGFYSIYQPPCYHIYIFPSRTIINFQTIYLAMYLFIQLFKYLSIWLSVCLFIFLAVYPFIYRSICLCIHLTTLSIYLSIHLPAY